MEVSEVVIFASGPYEVRVGTLTPEDAKRHYLVLHREYGVVEYETDILAAAIAWAKHFDEELGKMLRGEANQTEVMSQNVLPFSKPN